MKRLKILLLIPASIIELILGMVVEMVWLLHCFLDNIADLAGLLPNLEWYIGEKEKTVKEDNHGR